MPATRLPPADAARRRRCWAQRFERAGRSPVPPENGMRIIFLVVLAVAAQAADVPPGQRLYEANCAVCHDGATAARVPARAVIQRLPAPAILKSLESGAMRAQAAKLTAEERKQIAE